MKKIITILRAYFKMLFKRKPKFQIERLNICDGCIWRDGFVCSACGCYLEAKTREETEKCPRGKWHEIKEAR